MKKLILLLLLIFSTNTLAEWTKIGANADVTSYIDVKSVQKEGDEILAWALGNKVKVWMMNDYMTTQNQINGMKYSSDIVHYEYDCEKETQLILSAKSFSGHLGLGDIIGSVGLSNSTEEIVPGSISEIRYKIACDKK